MRKRLQAIRRDDSGFTLTELLIVIIILGVLTGIVVLAVGQFTDRGETSACKASMKTTEVAVESYRANHSGALPPAVNNPGPPLHVGNLDAMVPDYLRTNPNVGQTKYVITYFLAGRTNDPQGKPDLAAGSVTGSLAGSANEDCS